MADSAIVAVLEHYFPSWQAPDDDGKTWTQCLCCYHLEARPSAAVSYELEAFKCQACDFGGDIIKIIQMMEGDDCTFANAKSKAESIFASSGVEVPAVPPWQPRGGISPRKGSLGRKAKKPGSGLRGRTFGWS